MHGIIAVNGQIQGSQHAMVPALDRGFLFGDNVFEVLVGFQSKSGPHILDLQPHLERLHQSAADLAIPIPWSNEQLCFELQAVAEQIAVPKFYLRLVITRGSGLGLEFPEDTSPLRVVYGFPAKALPSSVYEQGLKLRLRKLPYTERKAAAKTGNYLRSILALRQAQEQGYDDVLWANADDELSEATTANVFFIGRQGDEVEIATPSINSGLLKGITRGHILHLLREAKIAAHEQIIYSDEIPRFDEAFLCSTVRGLVPIRQIDRHALHTARVGSVYRQIERLFTAWVTKELGRRVNWNTGH